jgi:hypothetical protein
LNQISGFENVKYLEAITFIPEYSHLSFEELRFNDYSRPRSEWPSECRLLSSSLPLSLSPSLKRVESLFSLIVVL